MTHFGQIKKILKEAKIEYEGGPINKHEDELVLSSGGMDTHILIRFKDGKLESITSDCLPDEEN